MIALRKESSPLALLLWAGVKERGFLWWDLTPGGRAALRCFRWGPWANGFRPASGSGGFGRESKRYFQNEWGSADGSDGSDGAVGFMVGPQIWERWADRGATSAGLRPPSPPFGTAERFWRTATISVGRTEKPRVKIEVDGGEGRDAGRGERNPHPWPP